MYIMNDFYTHVNSKWLENNDIPLDHSKYGTFECLGNSIRTIVEDIILNETHDSHVSTVYDIFSKEYSPDILLPILSKITSINSYDSLSIVGSQLQHITPVPLFNIWVGRLHDDNSQQRLEFGEKGFILPTAQHYINEKYAHIVSNYKKYISDVLSIYNLDYSVEDIFSFEKDMTMQKMSSEDSREIENLINIMSYDEIKEMLSPFNLDLYMARIFKNHPNISSYNNEIIVSSLHYLKNFSSTIKKFSIETIRNYYCFRTIHSFLHLINKNLTTLQFQFLRHFTGAKEQQSDIRENIKKIIPLVGELVSIKYNSQYMNDGIRTYVSNMCENIKNGATELISKCSWMSEETKRKSIIKIKKIGIKIGYSSVIQYNYDEIMKNIDRSTDTIECIYIFSSYFFRKEFDKIGNLPNKERWSIFSYDVNAYYSPSNNEMVFPTAILQEPFFSLSYTYAENLGGIGTIIAHEISHGFDDQGRKFDDQGNYSMWWSEEDISKYKLLIQPLIEQFDKIVIHDTKVSGVLTLGENLADYTSLTIISNILKKSNASVAMYKKTYEKYANIWKSNALKEIMITKILTDPHAQSVLRVNQILPNIPQFNVIYDITEESDMFIPDHLKIKLWI